MKIKSGFILRTIAGCNVVVTVGKRTLDFNGMINLNETGAFLWKQLEHETTEDALVSAVLENFEEVDEETARSSIREFLDTLRESGGIDE